MNEKQGLRQLWDQFNFIANEPLKINIALFIDAVLGSISLFEIDAVLNDIFKSFFVFCLIVNFILIVSSVIYIANLQDKPSSLFDVKFEYRRSLNSTRELQKILVQNVDSNRFVTARTQAQFNNNLVRYESFVLSFERYGYIYIRMPQKVDSRRDRDVFDDIADDISISLGMRKTAFQSLVIEESFGFGQIKLKRYLVMRIIK